jgi:hypothetical protein
VLTCLESDHDPNTIVIEDSFLFPTVIYTSRYRKRFRSYGHWKLEEASVLDRSGSLVKFRVDAYFEWGTGGAMNTRVLENFITFLTMGTTHNSDLERRNFDRLNLNDIIRYDFPLLINFKFLSIFNFH